MPALIKLAPADTDRSGRYAAVPVGAPWVRLAVVMTDGCSTADHAQEALFDAAEAAGLSVNFDPADLAQVVRWCAAQWQAALADMPAEVDRDTDGDDSERYLECHILATWEV
jgi:hypothetical protein